MTLNKSANIKAMEGNREDIPYVWLCELITSMSEIVLYKISIEYENITVEKIYIAYLNGCNLT